MMTTTVKKKKGVNGKAKGNGFELKVSKMLGAALEPLQFKRSQQSGAIVGGQNAIHLDKYSKATLRLFVGDVVPINEGEGDVPLFRFSTECKFYKDVENIKHIMAGKAKIFGWMNEARTDAVKLDLEPILIFKYNNTPIFTCTDKDLDLPEGVDFITLQNGDKVAEFDELLKHRDWWLLKS